MLSGQLETHRACRKQTKKTDGVATPSAANGLAYCGPPPRSEGGNSKSLRMRAPIHIGTQARIWIPPISMFKLLLWAHLTFTARKGTKNAVSSTGNYCTNCSSLMQMVQLNLRRKRRLDQSLASVNNADEPNRNTLSTLSTRCAYYYVEEYSV